MAEASMRSTTRQIAVAVLAGVSLTLSPWLARPAEDPAQTYCTTPSPTNSACPPKGAGESFAPLLVIGFAGGYVKRGDMAHGEIQFAQHLRQEYPSGVDVEIFENHHAESAHQQVLRLLDTDHDGVLTEAEKQRARIVLYGHSWGGSETVAMAKRLQREGIPVLLTIQVDSVQKQGEHDGVIPSNVLEAINFYQQDGLLHGRSEIHAAEPATTRILGNFRFDYKGQKVPCDRYPWYARLFTKPHLEIESDPRVWNKVDSLIRSEFPAKVSAASAGTPFPPLQDESTGPRPKPIQRDGTPAGSIPEL